jgi:hypothetical protein
MPKAMGVKKNLGPLNISYIGVSIHPKSDKFVAQYKSNGINNYLGIHKNPIDAACKYDVAKYDLWVAGRQKKKHKPKLNFGVPGLPETQAKILAARQWLAQKDPRYTIAPSPPKAPAAKSLVTWDGCISWCPKLKLWRASVNLSFGMSDSYEQALQLCQEGFESIIAECASPSLLAKRLSSSEEVSQNKKAKSDNTNEAVAAALTFSGKLDSKINYDCLFDSDQDPAPNLEDEFSLDNFDIANVLRSSPSLSG